jgi:NAD(P)-dependent dehydrogenase (short-subunit alcohol dehydrogenase family)
MMLNELRIVITGVAGTVGQAAAEKAKSQGATTIGIDILDAPRIDHVDEYHRVDLLNQRAVLDWFASIDEIDALFNIAGGFAMGDQAFDPTSEHWERMFSLNVNTMRNATMGAVPHMLKQSGGAIVNIGALGALSGQASMSAYCCAKSSVMKLTESLSAELRGAHINVNAVLPSIIDTPPNRRDMPDADFSSWVSPDELADVICFLASSSASAIHGALLPVRGLS